MKHKSGSIHFIFLIAFGLIIICVFTYYFFIPKNFEACIKVSGRININLVSQLCDSVFKNHTDLLTTNEIGQIVPYVVNENDSLSTTTPLVDFTTYTTDDYGFELQYPKNWEIAEYYSILDKDVVTEVAIGPSVATQEMHDTLDIMSGLITINFALIGGDFEEYKDVSIGYNDQINAKFKDYFNDEDHPNLLFKNSHVIEYLIPFKNEQYFKITYFSESDLEDKHLATFNTILTTLRFTN